MSVPPAELIIDTHDTEQTVAVGAAVGQCCQMGDLIALEGELGAGKTQFVRGLAQGLGLDPRQVNSPTFVMVQEYEPGDPNGEKPILVHIDAYRLKSEEDLASIGWHGQGQELREDAVVAVEWASLIEHALGGDMLWVSIAHEQAGRRLCLSARGSWSDKMHAITEALSASGMTPVQGAKP